jgi:hypothetical protein
MNPIKFIRDIIFCIVIVNALFFLLSSIADTRFTVSQQQGKEIRLMPVEALLRGQIEVSDKQQISNWRSSKNAVHWKFSCQQKGLYEITILHDAVSKEATIDIVCEGQQLSHKLTTKSKETRMGEVQLNQGAQSLALMVLEMKKKSKIPNIHSILLTKIN